MWHPLLRRARAIARLKSTLSGVLWTGRRDAACEIHLVGPSRASTGWISCAVSPEVLRCRAEYAHFVRGMCPLGLAEDRVCRPRPGEPLRMG